MRLAGPAEVVETNGMKPRPASFVDNKLKQRVIQVCILHGRASQWSAFAAQGPLLRAAPWSNLIGRPGWVRRGTVDSSHVRVVQGLASSLWGGVSRRSPRKWEGAAWWASRVGF